ncbi:MAG TPA: pirin family protein [Pseudonocardia sp.]|uniref:pirin family protein n=1 Tax=Pseudonocardia sp. TaxID=60912 RepID=UPI002B4AB6EB|nr:pirin family protein [Pseudonocardia sp.]HLU59386.1 pirin family protein [Pseudonocardia sp.]
MRTVVRVEEALHAGPDAEVDDKWLHVRPHDPARTAPFLVLSEDRITAPGFDWHPHHGIETVTVVLDGALEHEDDAGGAGVLRAGDAQWMTAGRGITHREVAAAGGHAHVLQLWRDLPAQARSAAPGHQQLRAADRPRIVRPGVEIDVLAGWVDGVAGPARPAAPAQVVLVTLEPGAVLELPVPAEHRAFALVVEGDATVAGTPVGARRTAWSEPGPGTRLALAGGATGARLLVASARP